MTTATAGRVDEMVALAERRAAEFAGPDGEAPTVEAFKNSGGRGFFVLYDDETTGALVSIKFHGGRTSTKVVVQNKALKCYEAASLAKLIQTAADFAALIDLNR